MTAPLDPVRLAAVLGMLGSDALGERASAALVANRMVKAAGLTWGDVIAPPPAVRPRSSPQQDQPGRAAAMATCRRFAGHLTAWECAFVDGIGRRRNLTPKQLATLAGIAAELPGRAV